MTDMNPADVRAGVRCAVQAWLDANGADIAEMIAAAVAEAVAREAIDAIRKSR